jgi:hypothetical protein
MWVEELKTTGELESLEGEWRSLYNRCEDATPSIPRLG